MKYFLIFLLLSTPALARDKKVTRKNVNLTVGLTYDEKLPFLPKGPSFEGNFKQCVSLSLSSETKTLRFNPKAVGTCSLVVRDNRKRKVYEFRMVVKKSDLYQIAREIKSLLGEIEGITIKIVNNKIVVDGQILLPRDMNRIYSVVSEYGNNASSLVTLSPIAQKKIASFIEREIANEEIRVRAINNKFILEGVADDPAEKQRAEIIAKTYVPDVIVKKAEADGLIKKRKAEKTVINLITVKSAPPPEPGKIIQIVVHYVELKKDYTRGFRFDWRPSLGDGSSLNFSTGDRSAAGITSQITGTISNLLPKLNWAKAHGHARVLQSSSLIIQDQKQGTLKSLTRIPYQTTDGNGQVRTDFENAGIQTTITPRIMGDRSDSIHLDIQFEISALLGMTNSGPLTSNSNITTSIMVRSEQSAAIGGLVQSSSGTDYNKLPPGSSSNPIFSLFASKNFRRDQSQFVVFITPVIKSSASEGADRIKKKFRLMN